MSAVPQTILLLGSGGREHAMAWALARSLGRGDRLFIAPGNPGTAACGTNVPVDIADHGAVIAFCRSENVGLVVVGPEAPLVAGIVDDLAAAGIPAFGPTKAAAQLEGSKGFTKDLCREHGIPTAAYRRFDDAAAAKAYLQDVGAPIVVKADGLAAGKGVVVAGTLAEAEEAVSGMLSSPGAEVVIEEYLDGEEASFFALCDGIQAIPFGTAQDHKRAFDGDLGPNTGGMGAYSPAPVLTPALEARVMREIVEPTLRAMSERGTPFRGILYAGLMITAEGPKLIEYNVRFGDPEAQAILPRLKTKLRDAIQPAGNQRLDVVASRGGVEWLDEAALSVVLTAKGYPGPVERGSVIRGIETAEALPDVQVFHAGTALRDGVLVANGGRVLAVTALGPSIAAAQAKAYAAVDRIDWPGGFCRRDIGWRAVGREQG